MKLGLEYYLNDDVLFIGKDLIGKVLLTHFDNTLTGGIIIETESYMGIQDRACHAYNNRRTKRNEIMYASGGYAYVFRCYGIHALFNVVTSAKDTPNAVLIRAIKPIIGIEKMLQRRNKHRVDRTFSAGPGTLTQALGIGVKHNGCSLVGDLIWIEDQNLPFSREAICTSPRIGIDYAGPDMLKPWRFYINPKEI